MKSLFVCVFAISIVSSSISAMTTKHQNMTAEDQKKYDQFVELGNKALNQNMFLAAEYFMNIAANTIAKYPGLDATPVTSQLKEILFKKLASAPQTCSPITHKKRKHEEVSTMQKT